MSRTSVGAILEEQLNPSTSPNQELETLIQQLLASLPAREVHFGPTPPDNPEDGDLWYHPEENRLYAYVE